MKDIRDSLAGDNRPNDDDDNRRNDDVNDDGNDDGNDDTKKKLDACNTEYNNLLLEYN